jgi:hypothetical protein
MITTKGISRFALVLALSATILAGCDSDSPTSPNSSSGGGIFIITGDFNTGSTAFLAPDALTADINLLTVHGDAVARAFDGKVYVVNRLGADNILVLDQSDLRTPLIQFSVGNGSNPQDIEVVSAAKAYVTGLARADVAIFNPQDGSELGSIDLSAFADGDGLPELTQMAQAGSFLYVLAQRLENFAPVDVSYLVVIDTNTDSVIDMDANTDGVQAVVLAAPNPNGIVVVGSKLIVSQVSAFLDRSGGIEVFELAADGALGSSQGLVVDEQMLDGDINGIAMVDENSGFALISDENFANFVTPFDLATGVVGERLSDLSTGFIQSMEVDGDRLIVGDRGTFDRPEASGLMIFDVNTKQVLAGPISTGLPPASIVILE